MAVFYMTLILVVVVVVVGEATICGGAGRAGDWRHLTVLLGHEVCVGMVAGHFGVWCGWGQLGKVEHGADVVALGEVGLRIGHARRLQELLGVAGRAASGRGGSRLGWQGGGGGKVAAVEEVGGGVLGGEFAGAVEQSHAHQ